MTLFTKAITTGNKDAVKVLLDKGTNPDMRDSDGRTPLIQTAIDGRSELTSLFIQSGADVNAQDRNGYSALHFAAQEYYPAIVDELCRSGAIVDVTDRFGNTPLWRATFASRGRGEVIKILLKYGADKDKRNQSNKSSIDLAKTIANYDLLQFFR